MADPIPTGTISIFATANVPTGWTKDTTNFNDYALRVINGTVANNTAGLAFSSVFATVTPSGNANIAIDATTGVTTLTAPQLPVHSHVSVYGPTGVNPAARTGGPGATRAVLGAVAGVWAPAGNTYSGAGKTGPIGPTAAQGHSHPASPGGGALTFSTISFGVKYIDCIRATKN